MKALEKSTNKQRTVGYWLGLKLAPHAIAAKSGLPLTSVQRMINLPIVQTIAEMTRKGELDDLAEVVEARGILERAAPRAAEKIVEIMEIAQEEGVQLKAAESVLDRTGHGKQTEVKRTVIYLDHEAIKLIEDTKKLIPEADWEELEEEEDDTRGLGRTDDISGEGSEGPSRRPAGATDGGSPGQSPEPPVQHGDNGETALDPPATEGGERSDVEPTEPV